MKTENLCLKLDQEIENKWSNFEKLLESDKNTKNKFNSILSYTDKYNTSLKFVNSKKTIILMILFPSEKRDQLLEISQDENIMNLALQIKKIGNKDIVNKLIKITSSDNLSNFIKSMNDPEIIDFTMKVVNSESLPSLMETISTVPSKNVFNYARNLFTLDNYDSIKNNLSSHFKQIGDEGELIVFQDLKNKFGEQNVTLTSIQGVGEYDILVETSSFNIFVEVKSTVTSTENEKQEIHIQKYQYKYLQQFDKNATDQYWIARCFNKTKRIDYIRLIKQNI